MAEIGIGLVGGGYMGKAHAVAMGAVGAVFDTPLRPRLVAVCGSSPASSERYRAAFGFERAAEDWRALVADADVGAVVIASPQATHREIAQAAFAAGKHVFCEKPLGASLDDATAMTEAAEASGRAHMIGFNYIRTPASQYARRVLAEGRIGAVTWFRGEHTEDFDADPDAPPTWRSEGEANGTLGDLAPHMINAARALVGPVTAVMADIVTVHPARGNDDTVQMMMRFEGGVSGHLFASRTATGRKMGYAYEIHGTKGAIRFDQEDQNALELYLAEGPEAERGFRRILTGPAHPDYRAFCQGPGHGTGYQDQIIIEARDFLHAIHTGAPVWPTFREGLEVAKVAAAARESAASGGWVRVG